MKTLLKGQNKRNGNCTITLDLEKGEYRFRYLIDGSKWEND